MTTADLTTRRIAGATNPAGANLIRLVVVLALSCFSFVGVAQEKPAHANPGVKEVRGKAEKGDARAQFDLGLILGARQGDTNGLEVRDLLVPFPPAHYEIRAKAEKGDAQAQFDLGWMYDEGKSVERDSTEAVNWYLKAAEQGLAQAQFTLGVMYHTGQGVVKDETQAARWYRKAADRGDSTAQLVLGARYADGNGVPKSDE